MPMGMTDAGHVVHAKNMLSEVYHLAWGRLPVGYQDAWNLGDAPPVPLSVVWSDTIVKGAQAGKDALLHTGVIKVISVKQDATTYTATTDFILDGNLINWAPAGIEPAAGTLYQVVYRANYDQINALLQEAGRREPTIQQYCKLDENGDIVANNTSWSLSETPTRNLYLQFKFDASEAVGVIIHQIGLFTGTTRQAAVPAGKKYLTPAEVLDSGSLYMIENIEPFSRYAGKREIFEYVLTF